MNDEHARNTTRAVDRARKIVLETLGENIGAPSCQHMIVFTDRDDEEDLIESTAREIRTSPDLSRRTHSEKPIPRLLAVRLATRDRTIEGIGDFWLAALSGLRTAVDQEAHEHGDRWLTALSEIERAIRTEEHARIIILRTAGQLDRQIVLMVESARTLFESDAIDRDFGWRLRHTLQTQPRIMMLCTTTHDCKAADNARQQILAMLRPIDARAS